MIRLLVTRDSLLDCPAEADNTSVEETSPSKQEVVASESCKGVIGGLENVFSLIVDDLTRYRWLSTRPTTKFKRRLIDDRGHNHRHQISHTIQKNTRYPHF